MGNDGKYNEKYEDLNVHAVTIIHNKTKLVQY